MRRRFSTVTICFPICFLYEYLKLASTLMTLGCTFGANKNKYMRHIKHSFLRSSFFVFLLAGLAACNHRYQVKRGDYKEYGISSEIGEDSSIVRYYLPYKQKMQAEMSTVIGKSDVVISGGRDPETLLGNFFSDAVLAQGLKLDPSIQFTFATKGGLRNDLPKGDITINDIFELMPFENELMSLKLSGTDVQKLIDFIAKSDGQPVAGLTMKIVNNKAYDVKIGGKPFDPASTYNLLTYDYLANGGGDLAFLGNAIEKKTLGKKLRDSLLDQIKEATAKGETITAKLDGRIIVENK